MSRPIDALPIWHGIPVPYVARWHGEFVDDKVMYNPTTGAIAYADELAVDYDEHGVLWGRDIDRRGRTSPEFSMVHALRQRRCMRQRRCQVCGQKVEAPYTFLMVDLEFDWSYTLNGETDTPPVCEECAEDAPRWCPALAKGHHRLLVQDFEDVGVRGQLWWVEKGRLRTSSGQRLHYDDPQIKALLAGNVTVKLIEAKEMT